MTPEKTITHSAMLLIMQSAAGARREQRGFDEFLIVPKYDADSDTTTETVMRVIKDDATG